MQNQVNNLSSSLSKLFDIPFSVSAEERRKRMLKMMLWLFLFVALSVLVLVLAIGATKKDAIQRDIQSVAISAVLVAVVCAALLSLTRLGSGLTARIIFVALLLAVCLFDTPAQVAGGRSLLYFSLPIIVASVVLRPWAGFVVAGISTIIVSFFALALVKIALPFPPIINFFILAIFIWFTTFSLERHIGRLGETNRALIESEDRYRNLIELSPNMVTLIDLDGRIIFINPAGAELFGDVTPDEMVGKAFEALIAPEDRGTAQAEIQRVREAEAVWHIECRALKADGAPFFIELNASVIREVSGQPQAILLLGMDISIRKQTEQALRTAKGKLEEQVSVRTLELEQTVDELRRTNENLQEHLSKIAALQLELQQQAIRDQVTGVFNRRYLEETLNREFARARRHLQPVSILMMDLDHFKIVNDTYGHKCGDMVLKVLGKLLMEGVRREDTVCRYGGEEFVVVMPEVPLAVASERAEAIRASLDKLNLTYEGATVHVTISLGVAAYPTHGLTGEEVLIRADRALYQSKQAGRNRVTIYEHTFHIPRPGNSGY